MQTTINQDPKFATLPEGHPVQIYFEERDLIKTLLAELLSTDASEDFQKYFNIFNHLCTIEKRFARKENQLFPFLEKRHWTGPSKGMWSFHDNLRDQIRLIKYYIKTQNAPKINENTKYLVDGIYRLMHVEENTLFPNALAILEENDWIEMRSGEEEIGWMLSRVPAPFPQQTTNIMNIEVKEPITDSKHGNSHHFDEGYMTVEQVNLLFRTIPADLTYVDENDKVIFYNRGEERVFPRSAGIIGREVKFCHPPKSVGTVLQILEEFRKGTKSEASFWINYKERLIYIRYFAVRDDKQNYRGVIEMSQDITEMKTIEGEKRLLEWK